MNEKHPALNLEHVTVELGGDVILKDVNFQVHHGDTIVIIGPSGSGKTVLLKTMAGIYHPTQGRVFCEGEDWANLQSEEKHRLASKIGMQFQRSALFDNLSVAGNVAFPLQEHHPEVSEEEVDRRVSEALASVNLSAAIHQMPHELSGGMKQRLAIARAIVLNPEIVFYDDPTAGLDPVNSDQMAELILDLKKKYNSTLIIVTHDLLRAWQMAGRIFMVANHEVIETGGAKETQHHPDPRVKQFLKGELKGPLDWG